MHIKWRPDYELGIAKIDIQHMRLVGFINRMADVKNEKKGRDTMETVFTGLVDYCNYHFTIEEVAMKAHGFPGYENHKAQHKLFTQTIKKYKKDYLSGNDQFLTETIEYLHNWLIEHITVEDRKYVSMLKTKLR